MNTKTQTNAAKADTIFVSNDGEFVAVKIPDNNAPPDAPGFDVWRHDGSEFWEGVRYIERPDAAGEFAPRMTYQKRYTHPIKCVVAYTKQGIASFDLELWNTETADTFVVRFNASIGSLAPSFVKRRDKKDE